MESSTFTFRPRSARWLVAGSWLLVGGLGLGAVVQGTAAWRVVLVALFVGYLAWWTMWFPRVDVDDDAVTVVNPATTVIVPWAALIDVGTRYSLSLVTPHRTVSAWAAPGPGRHVVAMATTTDLEDLPRSAYDAQGSVSIGALTRSLSGNAAAVVRRHWEELVENERLPLGEAGTAPVPVRRNTPQIAVALVLLVATVLAFTVGR